MWGTFFHCLHCMYGRYVSCLMAEAHVLQIRPSSMGSLVVSRYLLNIKSYIVAFPNRSIRLIGRFSNLSSLPDESKVNACLHNHFYPTSVILKTAPSKSSASHCNNPKVLDAVACTASFTFNIVPGRK